MKTIMPAQNEFDKDVIAYNKKLRGEMLQKMMDKKEGDKK